MALRHSVHHLQSENSDAWMGLIDAVYAVAMTLIAVELPELVNTLVNVPPGAIDVSMKIIVIAYLFAAYVITFMVLYELWSTQKCIIKIGGLNRQLQNFINGMLLAFTCLGAGDVILIIKVKSGTFAQMLNGDMNGRQGIGGFYSVIMEWANLHHLYWIIAFLVISAMYFLMYIHFCIGQPEALSSHVSQLRRSLLVKTCFFMVSTVIWLPLLWGGSCSIPPIYPVILFLGFSFFEASIVSKLKREKSDT